MDENLLTTAQVARVLGVRTSTVFDLRRESELAGIAPPCKPKREAKRWLASPAVLCRWLGAVIEHRASPGAALQPDPDGTTPTTYEPRQAANLTSYARALTVPR